MTKEEKAKDACPECENGITPWETTCGVCQGKQEPDLRKKLIEWITSYKDVAGRDALAESPDESAGYLLALRGDVRKQERERIRQKLQHSGGVMDVLWITEEDWQALKEKK